MTGGSSERYFMLSSPCFAFATAIELPGVFALVRLARHGLWTGRRMQKADGLIRIVNQKPKDPRPCGAGVDELPWWDEVAKGLRVERYHARFALPRTS